MSRSEAAKLWQERLRRFEPALASTTIELPGGVRIRVEAPAHPRPSERPEARP